VDLLRAHPELLVAEAIKGIKIVAYEPAFGIIGDPAKRDPRTRQSADHSMVFIVSRMLQRAIELGEVPAGNDDAWRSLMLMPEDYAPQAIVDPKTRALMELISFAHGGADYDEKYPDGIPTSIEITTQAGEVFDSGLVMYPSGHARNTTADLEGILGEKMRRMGAIALAEPGPVVDRFRNIGSLDVSALTQVHTFDLLDRGPYE
jgi:2-methylcitrate dehydratase